jgi:hypothetical protein
VLFSKRFWSLISDGTMTVTFRRWRRCQVVAGRRYRTPGGIIEVDTVSVVDPASIGDYDATASGFATAAEVVAALRPGDEPVYRVGFHLAAGPDPRAELAVSDALTADDIADIDRRLARLDRASASGPWTAATLAAIDRHPATRAADLAAAAGRDTPSFKLDVRKLKNLGLTISLERGYCLSPRGRAYLDRR